MKKIDISRAWRDEDYYLSLTEAERAGLPANPAAPITVATDTLSAVSGGVLTRLACSTKTSICSPCPPAVCP